VQREFQVNAYWLYASESNFLSENSKLKKHAFHSKWTEKFVILLHDFTKTTIARKAVLSGPKHRAVQWVSCQYVNEDRD